MTTDHGHDAGSGHDSNADIDVGLIVGLAVGNALNADAAKRPRLPAEPYVEPDYGAVWERRWRWIRPVLVAVATVAIATLFLRGFLP